MKRTRFCVGALHLSPLARRGRIASAIRVRGSFLKRRVNRFKYASQVALHVIVPKSQDAEIAPNEPFVARGVVTAVRMLTTVNLDDQSAFPADKIHSVRSHSAAHADNPPHPSCFARRPLAAGGERQQYHGNT